MNESMASEQTGKQSGGFIFSHPINPSNIKFDIGIFGERVIQLPDSDDECDRQYEQQCSDTNEKFDITSVFGERVIFDLVDDDEEYTEYPEEAYGPESRNQTLEELGALSAMEKRRSYCGKMLGKQFRPETGEYDKARYHCGIWRDGFCPDCLAYRMKHFKRQVQATVFEASKAERRVVKVITDEKGGKSVCASLKKKQYKRFPQKDGSVIFFIDDDGTIPQEKLDEIGNAQEVCWDETEVTDWDNIVNTPPTNRVTGSAGSQSSSLSENEALIKVPQFTVHPDTTPEQEIEALKKTFEETKDLDPSTPDELEEALETRTKAFVKHLRSAGGKLLHAVNHKTQKVQISHIRWKNIYELFEIENMVYVEKPPPKTPEAVS